MSITELYWDFQYISQYKYVLANRIFPFQMINLFGVESEEKRGTKVSEHALCNRYSK